MTTTIKHLRKLAVSLIFVSASFTTHAQGKLVLIKSAQPDEARAIDEDHIKITKKSGTKHRIAGFSLLEHHSIITTTDTIALSAIAKINCKVKKGVWANIGGYGMAATGTLIVLSGGAALIWNGFSNSSDFFPEESNGPPIAGILAGTALAAGGYLIAGLPRSYAIGEDWKIKIIR